MSTSVNEPGVVVARIAVEVVEVVEKPKAAEEGAELPPKPARLLRVKRKQPPLKQRLLKQKNPPSNNKLYISL